MCGKQSGLKLNKMLAANRRRQECRESRWWARQRNWEILDISGVTFACGHQALLDNRLPMSRSQDALFRIMSARKNKLSTLRLRPRLHCLERFSFLQATTIFFLREED